MATVSYPVDDWVPLTFGPEKSQRVLILVMSHPDEAPTMTEMEYFTPSIDRENLNDTVSSLIDAGILERVGDDDEFIGFTKQGKQFMLDSKLFRGSEVLKVVTQKTEMTDAVEDAFEKRRPDSYLRTIVQPEFEEREWVRKTEGWSKAWDGIQNRLFLTVEEDGAQTGLHITLERTVEPQSEETKVVLDKFYEWDAEALNALGEHEPIDVERTQLITVPQCGQERAFSVEIEEYFDNSLDPSLNVGIEKDSGTRVISAYIRVKKTN